MALPISRQAYAHRNMPYRKDKSWINIERYLFSSSIFNEMIILY
ncbi:hypothetical protein VMF7928_02866 [Vibrio marisflavi CECT 7928]|uniref:Uncharacterized protein n=1 Tax=Vibrio marisflavi CECT 7928 TaxID=634439 RepID=A0ABN8E693_9VIBR|nr:hypothetical protein VMF7928_02866 [Vibrio marisflavi CECT 7928]